MEGNIRFSTQIKEEDLYRYNLHHAYTSMQGIFSILISALLLVTWALQFEKLSSVYVVLYPVIAILFLCYIPANLKLKSKQQMSQEVFKHPLDYELCDTCIRVSSITCEEESELPLEYIYKVVVWKEYLLIYTNRVNAYIVPQKDISGIYDSVKEYFKNHLEDYKLSIK